MNSILLMDKEKGITSFDLIRRQKREIGKGVKIGHAGTLDKFATGLMIVLTGSCTRLCQTFTSFDKEYLAEISFGTETSTLDPEGEAVRTAPRPSHEALEAVLPSFIGTIDQVPPEYSAIHVNGRRAYLEARSGRSVEMPSRKVTVSSINLISYDGEKAVIRTSVSKGTYIRSLARDIALAAGSAAHLSNLRRLRIGPWTLDDIGSSSMDLLEKTGLFSSVSVDKAMWKLAENGYIERKSASDSDNALPYCFITLDKLYAIGEKTEDRIRILARVNEDF